MPYRPRWLNHIYAVVTGYFWAPCPLCGEMFGGHEWRDGHTLWNEPDLGILTCPRCKPETPRQGMLELDDKLMLRHADGSPYMNVFDYFAQRSGL